MSREEDDVVTALSNLCGSMELRCVVQVGAEDGYEVHQAAIRNPGMRAIAIEAEPKRVPCNEALEFHHAVIGATDCQTVFYRHSTPGLSGHFAREDGCETKVEVEQRRLDHFCAEHGIVPDGLIIDTEGTTLEVLEGCGALLDGVRMVYAEVQTTEIRPGIRLLPEVHEFLVSRGFVERGGPPSYGGPPQCNRTWVKP